MSVNIYNSNPNATSEEENFTPVADRGSKLASDTIYSNTTSGLNSVSVQGAIDEVNEKVEDNAEAISQINTDLTEFTTTYLAQLTNITLNQNFTCPSTGIVVLGGYDGVCARLKINGLEVFKASFPTTTLDGGTTFKNTKYSFRVKKNDVVYIECTDATRFNEHFLNPTV